MCIRDRSYAPKDFIVAMDQWQLPIEKSGQHVNKTNEPVKVLHTEKGLILESKLFRTEFSTVSGEMTSLKYGSKEMLLAGLRPNFWRPSTDNDVPSGLLSRSVESVSYTHLKIMKKKLLCCFTLLSMVAGQAMSQSQLCRPELTWGAYACISKVEINGMVSESSTTPEGWDGKIGSNTYDENVLFADYTMDKERVVTLEAGKEYELKITVCNFSSCLLYTS